MKKATKLFINFLNILIKILIVLLSITIQISFIYFFFLLQQLRIVYYISYILAIILAISIHNSDQNIDFKFSWIALIIVTPYISVVCYLLFGKGKTLPKRKFKKMELYLKDKMIKNDNIQEIRNSDANKHFQLLHNITSFPLYKNTQTEFIADGEKWFKLMLEDILSAKQYIFLEYFIISDGSALTQLIEALTKKADEGVQIKIIYDDIGSKKSLKQKTIDSINKHPNITMISYNPVGLVFSLKLNYRNHRKICIVDGKIAYCGGTNIADEYIHEKIRFGYWRDNVNRYIGDAIDSFLLIFASDWYMSCNEKLDISFYRQGIEKVESSSYVFPFFEGPTVEDKPAYSVFKSIINNVNQCLYISTPYFIIDRNFIETLTLAKKSGVDVRLLLPGIPDKKIVYLISKSHLGKLLKAGIKVYEYTPGFNHAKNFIIDDTLTFNGTINLDFRSLFLHFECGALHYDKKLNQEMKKDFMKAVSLSKEITYEDWKKRPLLEKLLGFFATVISPLL